VNDSLAGGRGRLAGWRWELGEALTPRILRGLLFGTWVRMCPHAVFVWGSSTSSRYETGRCLYDTFNAWLLAYQQQLCFSHAAKGNNHIACYCCLF
jgi:hypothetical protein